MAEKYYKVAESDLVAIADRTRAMVGISESLSIDEIIYWLGRVLYLPQAHASSEFAPDFNNDITGVLPTVVKALVNSPLTLDFDNSIVGILPAIVRATATSSLTLDFETSAIEYIEEE